MTSRQKIITIKKEHKQEEWINNLLKTEWDSGVIVSRGRIFNAGKLDGFIAVENDTFTGLATINISGNELEIITLNAVPKYKGIGTQLIERIISYAKEHNCKRISIVTTDNLDAIRFYQRRGFRLIKINRDAIKEYRKLKPTIPLTGNYKLPLLDELEFEMLL